MQIVFDTLSALIALTFLTILGIIAGVAIPGLFMAVAAPWLDKLMPLRDKKPR